MHSLISSASGDTQLFCRHLVLPHPHSQSHSFMWSVIPLPKTLPWTHRYYTTAGRDALGISLTWLPALTGTIWQPGMAGGNWRLPCYRISWTVQSQEKGKGQRITTYRILGWTRHLFTGTPGSTLTNTFLDLISRESLLLSMNNSAVTF